MTDAPRLRFVPALEGLRGLALAAVLCFHADLGWAAGGYLALTTFFVLSGYLVATLLFRDRDATTGTVLSSFWSRRARRLVPAGLLGLGVIVLFFAFVADPPQLANARGDMAAALASVINWRFILEDQSYVRLFGAPSPALHLWSLSVEAQYYLLFPLVFLGLGRVTARRGATGERVLAGAFVILAASSAGWGLWLSTHGAPYDRVYYGTDTRSGELLVGAALACWLASRRPTSQVVRPQGNRALQMAGVGALAVLFWMYATVELGSTWLVHGGFALVALVSAVAVAACLEPGGPLPRLLSTGPLRRLGLISYAVYLFHWPIYLWLRQSYGWSGWRQLVVGSGLAIVLAELSHRFVEDPVRSGRLVRGRERLLVPIAAVVLLAVSTVTVSEDVPVDPLAAIPAAADAPTAPPTAPVVEVSDTTPEQPTVLVVGDEAVPIVAAAIEQWDAADPAPSVEQRSEVPCGDALAEVAPEGPETCAGWVEDWGSAVQAGAPDVVVLAMAGLDVAGLLAAGGDATPDGLDPSDADTVRARLDAATTLLASAGAAVVLVELPSEVAGGQSTAEANIRLGYSGLRDLAMSRPELGYVAREELPPLPPENDLQAQAAWSGALSETLGPQLERALAGGAAPTAPKVMIVGDSMSWFIGRALEERSAEVGDLWAWNTAVYGCGIGRGGEIRVAWGDQPTLDSCNTWADRWAAQVNEFDPDVVVMLTGLWDFTDRRMPQWDGYRSVGDPEYDEWLLSEYEAAVDVLSAGDGHIIWLTTPCAEDLRGGVLTGTAAWDDDRLAHHNEVLLPELAARRDEVSLFDLQALACPNGAYTDTLGGFENARRDGAHFSDGAARWLVDQMVADLLAAATSSK